MVRISKHQKEVIIEHRLGVVKRNPMLGEIPLGFPWIPRERHESSIAPVPSLSGAMAAVAPRCLTTEASPAGPFVAGRVHAFDRVAIPPSGGRPWFHLASVDPIAKEAGKDDEARASHLELPGPLYGDPRPHRQPLFR